MSAYFFQKVGKNIEDNKWNRYTQYFRPEQKQKHTTFMYEKMRKTTALQKLIYTFSATPTAIPMVFMVRT